MTSPQPWTAPDPEVGPAPGVEYGTPGARLVAFIVDNLIQWGLTLALVLASAVLGAIFVPLGALAFVAGIAFLFIYFPYFWQKSGQTPGMRLVPYYVLSAGGVLVVSVLLLRGSHRPDGPGARGWVRRQRCGAPNDGHAKFCNQCATPV